MALISTTNTLSVEQWNYWEIKFSADNNAIQIIYLGHVGVHTVKKLTSKSEAGDPAMPMAPF